MATADERNGNVAGEAVSGKQQEARCETCGCVESDSKHIRYDRDLDNPMKHQFVRAARQAIQLSHASGEPGPSWGLVNQLEREIIRLVDEVYGWRREHNIYRTAWLREIGGFIRRKTWEIDGFVLRTRDALAEAEKRGAQAMAEKAAQLRKLIALYREQYPMEENRSGWGLAFEIERSLAGAEIPGQSPDVPKEAGAVRQAALSIRAVEAAADKGRG